MSDKYYAISATNWAAELIAESELAAEPAVELAAKFELAAKPAAVLATKPAADLVHFFGLCFNRLSSRTSLVASLLLLVGAFLVWNKSHI